MSQNFAMLRYLLYIVLYNMQMMAYACTRANDFVQKTIVGSSQVLLAYNILRC